MEHCRKQKLNPEKQSTLQLLKEKQHRNDNKIKRFCTELWIKGLLLPHKSLLF